MNLKKGDAVQIMKCKDRGKSGAVNAVLKEEGRVIVAGLNLFKKRQRPRKQGQKGETLMMPRPLQFSNVMLVCKNCKKPTRIGMRMEGDTKVRYCKKCEASTYPRARATKHPKPDDKGRSVQIRKTLDKIVLNAGVGRASQLPGFEDKALVQIMRDVELLAGQHPQ